MLNLKNVTLMRGTKTLLEDSNVMLNAGQRVGIIGRNGCGKTSLFAALAGNLPVEQGEIGLPEKMRIATMEQETAGSDKSAIDHVLDSDQEYRQLESRLHQAERDGNNAEIAAVHSEYDKIGAYDIDNRAEQLLSGLGFKPSEFRQPVSSFSGGWRVRLNLCAALMCPSDLLLLDEPTNHLDLEATLWLEQWLARYPGTLLMISHDRSFLDRVVNQILSFEGKKLRQYKGNYSDYEKLRAERLALEQAMYEKQQRRKGEIEDFVRRFRAKASKAKQAQSRLKELNRMQDIASAHIDSPFSFSFPELDRVPDFLLGVSAASIGYQQSIVEKIRFTVRGTSRIGLLGFNGSGKSTLLKSLSGKLPLLSGELEPSKHLKLGYFAQHQVDELDQHSTPLQTIQRLDRGATEQQIRDYLGGFDFRGERVDDEVSIFSGGEKARLALAKVTWEKPNLLLMDEPTNHLDLDMRHALTVALQEFSGALILVSHDRHLLANTVDDFYLIHQGSCEEFEGDLEDYAQWLRENSNASAARTEGLETTKLASEKVDKKELRQQAAQLRQQQAPLRKQASKLEKKLDEHTQRLVLIEAMLGDAEIYEDANKTKLTALLKEQGELKSAVELLEEEWMEVQEELE